MTEITLNSATSSPRSQRIFSVLCLLVLLFAFAVRLFAAQWWHGLAEKENRLFRFGDSQSYWTLGKAIAKGEPYQYGGEDGSVFRAPGYPLLLSTVAWLSPERYAVWIARIVGCTLGTLAVLFIMRIAYLLGGPWVSLSAGALSAVYPGAIGMSATILSEALFMPLMLLHLLLLQQAFQSSNRTNQIAQSMAKKPCMLDGRLALLSGLLAGAAILTRPSWLLFPPLAAILHLMINRNRDALAKCCWLAAGIILAMAPWWYRNYLVTDRFVLTTLQVGPSLYDGLHPGASGGSDEGMAFVGTFAESLRKKEAQAIQPLNGTFEYRLNRSMQQAALQWAFANPKETAHLALKKFTKTWNIWPPAQELSSIWVRFSETIGCFSILGLAILGSWAYRNHWHNFYLYFLPIPYFTLLHMVFVGSVRYRQPAIMAISVLAGMGIMWILQRLLENTKPRK